MIEKYIAPFNTDNERLLTAFSKQPEFKRGCLEMAVEFDLMLAVPRLGSISPDGVGMFTKSGILVGHLRYQRDYTRRAKQDFHFVFDSERLISKDRKSARSTRSERDSNEATGIIKAMRKHGEAPTEEKLMRRVTRGLRYAYDAITANSVNSPRVDLSEKESLSLLTHFLGLPSEVETHRHALMEKYEKHLQTLNARNAALRDVSRFTSGCTAIKIEENIYHPAAYLVGESCRDANGNITFTNYKRYETLADTEYAPLAAMIRTYAMGKDLYDEDNELGIKQIDCFLDELDISVGYDVRGGGPWVLIPKVGV